MPRKTQQLAKLSRPRLYNAVARERLYDLLDDRLQHPVVWIAAPPGAGKTTLVAGYWEHRKCSGIWYHVDAGDADLSTFFYHLAEATRNGRSRTPSLPLLTPEYLPDLTGFARRFFRELFARMPGGSMLVLDNFQDAPQQGTFPQALAQAVPELPEGVNLVCISRTDAPPEFSRYAATEEMVSLGWDDLRLTEAEAQAIAAVKRIEPDVARSLYRYCDGWAAGLTLTIERARRGGGQASGIKDLAREATFDYFATQILDSTAESDRAVLLKTAIFPTFSADLARGISGTSDADRLLDDLCRRHLFVYRRGGVDIRYQYHDLFREFLLARLHDTLSGEALEQLKRQGAALLCAGGMPEAAFPLLVEANAWDEAVRLIRTLAPRLLAQGRWQTLRDWIGQLPSTSVSDDSWLLYWLGNVRVYEDILNARSRFESAFEGFRRSDDALGQLLSAAWVIRTYYFEYTNFQPLDRWVDEISRMLEDDWNFEDSANEIHVLGALMIAFTYRQTGHPFTERVVGRLTALLHEDIDPNQQVAAATGLVVFHTLAMEPPRAREIVELIAPVVARNEVTPLNQAWWWMFVGYQYHRAGEKELTSEALERSDRIAAANGLRQTDFFSRCFRAYFSISWRDFARAKTAIGALEGTFSEQQPMNMAQFHLASYFLAISTADREGAAYHANTAVTYASKLGAPFFYVAWRAQCAAGPAQMGDFNLAEQWLDEAWVESEGTVLERYRATVLQSRAYCAMLQGETDRARSLLGQSIEIGKPFNAWPYGRGTVPVFEWMVEEALKWDVDVPYIQGYIRKFGLPPPSDDVLNWPWPVKVFTLGEFRVEIDGDVLTFPRKAPKKPLALLKAVIAMGGRNVPEQKLIDALWPDEEGDAAREAFAVSLHRLRKLLLHANAVQLMDGLVSLDAQKVWVDVWAFEHMCTVFDRIESSSSGGQVDRLWSVYHGHFLAGETDATWAVPLRERLRSRFMRALSAVACALEDASEKESALELYRRGIEADDLAEEFYQGAIRCLLGMGRCAEATALLRRLRQILSVTLGIKPSSKTEDLLRSAQGG